MKKFVLIGACAVAAIIVIAAAWSYQTQLESFNVERPSVAVNFENGSPILGADDAPITIVEFGDYQCEMCKRFHDHTRANLIENYIEPGHAKLVFVDLAFLGRDSPIAAQATYCANDQEKYWQYHTMLYNYQEEIDSGWANRDRLNSFAFSLNLDIDEFSECMDSKKYQKRVKSNYNEAVRQGASATPTFVIISNSGEIEKIRGAQPFSVFEKTIEKLI